MDLSDLSWATGPRVEAGDTFASALRAVRKPVIAAVNGPAITGGFELALGADFILASERAFFGDTHARVGVFPGGGMTVYLAQAVGVRRAGQLSYTGELIDAAEALRLGLANEVLPHAGLLPRAREVATAVAAVDATFLTELCAAYQRRGNLGTDDALDTERAASSRREIAADGASARRDEVITRGHRRIQREEPGAEMTEHASLVSLERRPDGVALITIDNPPVNALTTPLFAKLMAIIGELTADPPGAVVLAGRPKVFALGGEISETHRVRFAGRTDIGDDELGDAVRAVTEPAYIRELGGKYLATFDALAAVPCMVIAAITGITFGGGLELALACDYRSPPSVPSWGPPRSHWGAAASAAACSGCLASSAPRWRRRCTWGDCRSPRAKRCGSGLSTRWPTRTEQSLAPLNWPGRSPLTPGPRRPTSSGSSTPATDFPARRRARWNWKPGARPTRRTTPGPGCASSSPAAWTRAKPQNRSPRRRSRHCSAKASAFRWYERAAHARPMLCPAAGCRLTASCGTAVNNAWYSRVNSVQAVTQGSPLPH
jgi:enoyl-CoA hydratase/carnithine racemase